MTNPEIEEKDAAETGDKGGAEEPKETTTTAEAAPSDEAKGEKRAAGDGESDEKSKPASPKKAKIAMPPPVADNIMNVDKYTLDSPPPDSTESEDDIANKITSPCLILFGLHPLIREPPLRKMCEDYGKIKDMTVRSAFANRYGHVEFETVDEARGCYKALNGAKLLHKAIMVQPSKPQPSSSIKNTETQKAETSEES